MGMIGFLAAPVWIAALAIIWTTSRAVQPKLARDARLPFPFGLDLGGRFTLSRDAAFATAIGGPVLIGLALMAAARLWPQEPYEAVIMLALRISAAAGLALLHLAWLKRLTRASA